MCNNKPIKNNVRQKNEKRMAGKNEVRECFDDAFLEDVILNRAKGGEYTEVSEDYELKPSPILPIVCGAGGDVIYFPFGVIRGLSDENKEVYTFEFYEGELEKIKSKKSEWFNFCDEKACEYLKKRVNLVTADVGRMDSVKVENISGKDYGMPRTAGPSEGINAGLESEGANNVETVCEVYFESGETAGCDEYFKTKSKPKSEFSEKQIRICPKVERFEDTKDMVCVKRRVSKKYNTPDMSAVKLLLEMRSESQNGMTGLASEIKNMTNAEIERRKTELLEKILKGNLD